MKKEFSAGIAWEVRCVHTATVKIVSLCRCVSIVYSCLCVCACVSVQVCVCPSVVYLFLFRSIAHEN